MIAVPGVRVGCTYREKHTGEVLALNDPEAWTGTIAFFGPPDYIPSLSLVTAHVCRCLRTIPGFANEVPVKWDFGRVYWERIEALFPVSEGAP